jgi:hypothetical protein
MQKKVVSVFFLFFALMFSVYAENINIDLYGNQYKFPIAIEYLPNSSIYDDTVDCNYELNAFSYTNTGQLICTSNNAFVNATGGAATYTNIILKLDDTLRFNNGTTSVFWSQSGVFSEISVCFIDSNKNVASAFFSFSASMPCIQYFRSANTFIDTTSTQKIYINNLNSTENVLMQNVKYIMFSAINPAGVSSFYLDNITLNNVSNLANNSLPEIQELKVNNSGVICVDSENTTVSVPLLINVTDNENDQILYSEGVTKNTVYSTYFEEDFLKGECDADFSSIFSDNFISNNTKASNTAEAFAFNTLGLYNYHYVFSQQYYEDSVLWDIFYRPNSLISCSGNFVIWQQNEKPFFFISNLPIAQTAILYQDLKFPNNDTQVNYTLLSSDYQELANVFINLTEAGNMTVKYNGYLVSNELWDNRYLLHVSHNYNISNLKDMFTVSSYPSDLYDVYIYNVNNTNITAADLKGIRYNPQVQSTFNYKKIYLQNLAIKGNANVKSLVYTTTKPTSYTVTGSGTYHYTLYVTDSVHNGISNNNKTIDIVTKVSDSCINSVDLIGSVNDEVPYTPQIDNEFIRGLLSFFRTPRRLFDSLGIWSMFSLMSSGLLIYYLFTYWQRLQTQPALMGQVGFNSEDILRKVANRAFYIVTIMYLVFVLMDKTVFTFASTVFLLFFGLEVLDSLKFTSTNTDTEKRFIFGMAFFNLSSFIWFSLTQVVTGVDFGFPKLPTVNIFAGSWTTIQDNIWNLIKTLWNMIWFTIPDLPDWFGYLLLALRFLSLLMFAVFLWGLVPTVNKGS